MDMESIIRMGTSQIKDAVDKLISLDEKEFAVLSASLRSLEPPFGHREVRALGQKLSESSTRLSGGDWTDAVGIVLQSLADADFTSFLETSGIVDQKTRKRLETALQPFRSGHPIAKLVEIDGFIEQGPRLKRITCFCDVRTKFSRRKDAQTSGERYEPSEEFSLPMSIICMETDELENPIYFQLTARELTELIEVLDTARAELRYLSEREKK